MSRWHRENPELYAQGYEPWDGIEAQADAMRKGELTEEPCRVCGEYLTSGGRTCPRCEGNLQEERDDPARLQ